MRVSGSSCESKLAAASWAALMNKWISQRPYGARSSDEAFPGFRYASPGAIFASPLRGEFCRSWHIPSESCRSRPIPSEFCFIKLIPSDLYRSRPIPSELAAASWVGLFRILYRNIILLITQNCLSVEPIADFLRISAICNTRVHYAGAMWGWLGRPELLASRDGR